MSARLTIVAKAALIAGLALTLSACTSSYVRVSSSYPKMAQTLAKTFKPAVPNCGSNEELEMRAQVQTRARVDTNSRRVRPNEVQSMITVDRSNRCVPVAARR